MAIEQHMRRIGPDSFCVSHHHRMAGRGSDGSSKADAVQIIHKPLGRAGAVGLVVRIGGDGRDFQKIEKTVERRVLVRVDLVQDFADGRHESLRLMRLM